MSVIVVGGRAYAAGLYWLARGGRRATARMARRLGRPWYVHDGERTGFAADGGGRPESAGSKGGGPESRHPAGPGPEGLHPAGPDPEGSGPAALHPEGLGPAGLRPSGVPALALALKAHIDCEFWMALVGGSGADGGGRYALVKARGGAVLADGDEAFEDRAAALAAFERARDLGWALFATPGLAAELNGAGSEVAALDVAVLDAAAAGAGSAIVLTPAATARADRRLVAGVVGVAVLAAVAAAWFEREALFAWLAGPAPVPAVLVPGPEPTVAVAVDGAALIAACRQALIDHPPWLPAWRIEGIACAARFNDPALTALRPELAGGPVLLVRWRLAAEHNEALQRRLAEAHLARRHAASVSDGRAWAAVPLTPVLRVVDAETPPFLELRRAVDRAFGAAGAGVGYVRDAEGAWSVRIDDPGPLDRLGPRVGGIAGLEIVALTRGGDTRAWRLEARPAAPRTVAASELAALGIPERSPAPGRFDLPQGKPGEPQGAAATIRPEKEARDGTKDHRGF